MSTQTDISRRIELLGNVLEIGKKYSVEPRVDSKVRHYVYVIVNKYNHKIYVGKRKCKCPIENDTYFGSGNILVKKVKEFGRSNFEKIIVAELETEDDAYHLESIIVDWDFSKSIDTYNIVTGGRMFNNETTLKHRLDSNSMDNYQYKATERKDFKQKCKLREINFDDFEEVGIGEKAGKGSRLYFYFNKDKLKTCEETIKRYQECLKKEEEYLKQFSIRRYEEEEVTRDSFKSACKTRGVKFEDFEEVWSGLRLKDKYKESKHNSCLYLYFDKNIEYTECVLEKIKTLKENKEKHDSYLINNNNNRQIVPLEVYHRKSSARKDFKDKCNRRGINFEDFEEIEDLSFTGRCKKYFYISKKLIEEDLEIRILFENLKLGELARR